MFAMHIGQQVNCPDCPTVRAVEYTGKMNRQLITFLAAVMLASPAFSTPCDTLRAVKSGLVPDTYENCVSKIQEIMDTCRARRTAVLLLEPGRYDIWPEGAIRKEIYISNTSSEEECPSKVKTLGFPVIGQEGLTIDGQGALLMFHGKQTMVAIIESKGITLKNLRIDLERPAGSELTIEKCDPAANTVDVRLHRDSRYDIDRNGHIALIGEGWKSNRTLCIDYIAETDHFTGSEWWWMLEECPATEVEPGLVRFSVPDASLFPVGRTFTIRDIIRDQVGILNDESSDITFRHLEINYMNGFGILSQFCTNVTMDSLWLAPHKGSGRVLACSADFTHFSGCKGKVRILNSHFSGAHDDPINIHGTYLRITSAESNRLTARFSHPQSYGLKAFRTGDTVAFVSPKTMLRYAEAVVTSAEAINPYTMELTIDRNVPKGIDLTLDVLENMTWNPEVEIRGNWFTHTHTRGTLLSTPRKSVIADNTYCKTGMSAILIGGGAMGWFESGTVNDVLIQNNRFIDCGYNGDQAVIWIGPCHCRIDPKRPGHKNIRIIGNTFETFGNTPVFYRSVEGLIFKDNTVTGTPASEAVVQDSNVNGEF